MKVLTLPIISTDKFTAEFWQAEWSNAMDECVMWATCHIQGAELLYMQSRSRETRAHANWMKCRQENFLRMMEQLNQMDAA